MVRLLVGVLVTVFLTTLSVALSMMLIGVPFEHCFGGSLAVSTLAAWWVVSNRGRQPFFQGRRASSDAPKPCLCPVCHGRKTQLYCVNCGMRIALDAGSESQCWTPSCPETAQVERPCEYCKGTGTDDPGAQEPVGARTAQREAVLPSCGGCGNCTQCDYSPYRD